MKVVEKKLNKAQIATICLLIASILLLASYFTVRAIAEKLSDDSSNRVEKPEIFEGEGLYLNQPVAYPAIEDSQILFIEVKNDKGEFGVSRYPDENGSFMFHYYVDGEEKAIPYTPPIWGAEGDFKYESLYAIETGDGYGMMYFLTYLCSALGSPYYTERITLPSGEENAQKKEALLREYGLTQQSSYVYFTYAERDKSGKVIEGTESDHFIIIGDKAVSGNGYYYMVDNRDCVYYTASEYFTYALAGFNEFVKGMLVAGGRDDDPGISAALTADFKSWTGKMFKEESDRIFTSDMAGYEKYENPEVIVTGSSYIPIDKGTDYVPEDSAFDGYTRNEASKLNFNLQALRSHADYKRIKNVLVGKTNGSYEGNEILITILNRLYDSDSKTLDFSTSDTARYTYVISAIESVITDNGERTEGTVESSDNLIKVTYRYTVGGVTTGYDCHGVIDLTNLSNDDASKLRGLAIGPLSESVSISIEYTKENSLRSEEKYVLTGITSIYDESFAQTGVVTETSYVNISYYRVLDGVKGDTETVVVRPCDIKEDSKLYPLKKAILGEQKGDFNTVVYSDEYYYEYMREFVTYEISEIHYFVANEMIVSFEYYNASEWDPYYGETYYKNTLTNDHKLYGLNSDSCEKVVKFLTGLGTENNSTGSVGLSGETVAVGLTLDNMDKYGLFAHRIYIELPRGIDVLEDESDIGSSNPTSDYTWLSTLGFTLYISDATYDENGARIRYIGSDMYDLVAKVDATNFEFLERSFVEFWASRNIIMMNIKYLEELDIEFNMADLQGRYDFDVSVEDMYGGYINGKYEILDEKFDGSVRIEQERVNVTVKEGSFETELKKLADAAGESSYGLTPLYNHTMGDGSTLLYPNSYDTMGTAYFNSVYQLLMYTRYHSSLTAEEKEAAKDAECIFRLHIKVKDRDNYYTYDFYRIDDRRVMVSLYRSDAEGNKVDKGVEVSDFYITTFAFKKLVSNYIALLNGEQIDPTVGYLD